VFSARPDLGHPEVFSLPAPRIEVAAERRAWVPLPGAPIREPAQWLFALKLTLVLSPKCPFTLSNSGTVLLKARNGLVYALRHMTVALGDVPNFVPSGRLDRLVCQLARDAASPHKYKLAAIPANLAKLLILRLTSTLNQ